MSIFNQSYNQPSSCFGFCNNGSSSGISSHQNQQRHDDDHQLTLEDQQKKKEMDDLLAQAMSGLTFQERQEQQEKLHGVDNKIVENESVLISSAIERTGVSFAVYQRRECL